MCCLVRVHTGQPSLPESGLQIPHLPPHGLLQQCSETGSIRIERSTGVLAGIYICTYVHTYFYIYCTYVIRYVCTYVHTYVRIYNMAYCTLSNIHMYVHVYICHDLHVHMYVRKMPFECIHVRTCVRVYVYTYVCTCVCKCIDSSIQMLHTDSSVQMYLVCMFCVNPGTYVCVNSL